MSLKKRLAGPLAAVAACAAAVIPFAADSGTATAAVASPPGSYVVASVPLRNDATGVASWDYGYVQLWYSTSTASNWARVVFKLGGDTYILAEVNRSDGAQGWAYDNAG